MRFLFLLCLTPTLALAATTQQLAAEPETVIESGQCLVRGAVVLGDKPLGHANLDLVDPATGASYPARTGADGIYEATLPAGPIYQERLTAETRRRSVMAGSLLAPRVESPWVVCRKGVVEVGGLTVAPADMP